MAKKPAASDKAFSPPGGISFTNMKWVLTPGAPVVKARPVRHTLPDVRGPHRRAQPAIPLLISEVHTEEANP